MSKNYTILVIDDLYSSLKMIENFLGEYNVISAESGKQGLLLAEEYVPDLILLDVIMPEMTGFEVCEELKKKPDLKDIPVIFLTTCNRREDIDRSFDVGAFDYITKPVSGKALRAKIHAVFSILNKIRLKRKNDYNKKNEANEIFVKGMSHNFNNMFGGIIGMAQLLENLKIDDPKVKRYAKMIRTTSENGARLVSQLLEFSQSSDFSFVRVNAEDVITRAIDYFKTNINSSIQIKLVMATKNSITIGDPEKLFMVMKNLLENANEAMGDNPELIITTKNINVKDIQASKLAIDPGEYIKISVIDNGRGISEDIENKIFEPFFSTSDLSVSKGLGLAEARGIVHGHRGTIEYLNNPAGGAEFTVFLPVVKRLASPVAGRESVEDIEAEGRILLVDDEDISLLFAKEMLRKSGYEVITAENGEDALKIYQENMEDIDVVLSDIIMPKMNGIELAKELKAIDPAVKLIFMTGHTLNLEEKEIGFVKDVIKKPFRGGEIINLINNVMRV